MVYTQRKQPAVPSGPLGSTARASRIALFFSRKRKGEAKRKLPADVRKLKNDCEVRGKRTRRARFAAAVRLAIQLQVLDRYTSAQTSFSHVRPSPPFFFPLSPIGRTGLRVLVIAPDTVIWSSRTPMRDPGIPVLVIPHSDAGSRNTGRSTCKIHSLYVPFSGPRITCGVTRFSTRYPGYTRCLYRKKTAGSTVRASRDARPVHPESPFSFPAKEKGEPKESSRLMSES